jgi:TIGR03009 family protein
VTHYQCAFTRWQFDQEVCNYRNPENNHLTAAVISRGNIRYRQPDKGMYEVNEKWAFAGPPDETSGGEPKYERRKNGIEQEKWICDGQSIFEYDFDTKRLYEMTLPPEAQGEGLKNSPLPFVFGAKAVDLLDRYWIRDITPAGAPDQYWLEAWPKRASDAQTYSKIEIILSREPFLPTSIHMYASNYDEKTNPSKMVFEFEQREINGALAGLLDPFFIRPNTPFGWQRVQRDLSGNSDPGLPPQVGQATDATSPSR